MIRNNDQSNKTELNKKFIIGGSDIASRLDFFNPKIFEYFDPKKKPFKSKQENRKEFYDGVKKNKKKWDESHGYMLEWGNLHELAGVLAFLKKFDPNNAKVKESGTYHVKTKDSTDHHFICSPDGFYKMDVFCKKCEKCKCIDKKKCNNCKECKECIIGEEGCLEIKSLCPFIYDEKYKTFNYLKRVPWKHIPHYYVPQMQMEMHCSGMKRNCLVAYTPSSTSETGFYFMKYDESYVKLFFRCIKYAFKKYGNSKSPSQIPDDPFYGFSAYDELLEKTMELSTKFEYHTLNGGEMDVFYMKGDKFNKIFYGDPYIIKEKPTKEDKKEPKMKKVLKVRAKKKEPKKDKIEKPKKIKEDIKKYRSSTIEIKGNKRNSHKKIDLEDLQKIINLTSD